MLMRNLFSFENTFCFYWTNFRACRMFDCAFESGTVTLLELAELTFSFLVLLPPDLGVSYYSLAVDSLSFEPQKL